MRIRRTSNLLRFALLVVSAATCAPAQTLAGSEVQVAPGVSYRHITSTAPAGGPWSVHVLTFDRKIATRSTGSGSSARGGLTLRAVAGHAETGEMQRELPSRMGEQAGALAVVNGDYDMAAPYLGISDGLSVTSGQLWTTGRPEWPAMAILKSGEPAVAVPQVTLELSAGSAKWQIAALNKPLASVHGTGLRLYTREYRASIQSGTPFRAVVISGLSPALPLRVDSTVRGAVVGVVDSTRELPIPRDAMVLALRIPAESAALSISAGQASSPSAPMASLAELKPGTKVKLQMRVTLAGRRGVRDVIGGFPIIVRDGRREIVGKPTEYLSQRHPRTAVCYNREKIIFAVVDGRQPQLSVGMTLEELGDLMVSLGCTVAMNTDGGGSSVMAIVPAKYEATTARARHAVPLQIVNSPSDGQERGRGNAWAIVPKR